MSPIISPSGGGGSQPSVLTVATGPNTFQATPVLDFGASFIGGVVGIKIMPSSFVGDGETFGPAGGAELFLNSRLVDYECSSDGTRWRAAHSGSDQELAATIQNGASGSSVQDMYDLGKSVVKVLATARFLRWTMQLEDDNDGGKYAGPNHPVLTITLTVSTSAVLV